MAMAGKSIRILILDGSPADASMVERELRGAGLDFTTRCVGCRDDFMNALESFAPDIVLTEYELPDFDGLSALRAVRQRSADLPVIIVTGALGDEAAVHFVEAGANDYILKDRLTRLPVAVRRALVEAQEVRRRKGADRALAQSEERFRSLVETAGDWIWATDENGVYTYVSPRVEALLGYKPEELVGRLRFDFMPPAEARRFAAVFADIRDKGRPFSLIEVTIRRKNGQEATVETSAVPVFENGILKGYRGIDRDVTEHRAAEQAIARLAHTEALTGLANRAAFLERLHQAFARARRTGESFSVLFLDLDHFKDINDTLGHIVGDSLLRDVAARQRGVVRAIDMVARFGGDEFAVLQTDVEDAADAGTLATKILEAVSKPFTIRNNQVNITASIGIAIYQPGLDSPEALLTQADLALYRAKDEGRSRFAFHTQALDDEVRERVALAEDLRVALERNDLSLYYQPQVVVPDGRIVGMEALLRWHHPQRGLILPDAFLPVAERRGLMQVLDHWVLETACAQIRAWLDAGLNVPVISLNLSAAQFKVSPAFEREVSDILTKHGLQPSDVELDVTEAVLMEAARRNGVKIRQMCMLGLRFALDDFGIGYSSLSDLLTYRFTRLKIARQLIDAAQSGEHDAAIVRAAISLARELGIEVMAEGVETKAQMDFLIAAGCTVAQGYYFARPVPADRAADLLRQGRIDAQAAPPSESAASQAS